jgi:hypothetical protein
MSNISVWQEVDSKVFYPRTGIGFLLGVLFILTGIIAFFFIVADLHLPSTVQWIFASIMGGTFTFFGLTLIVCCISRMCWMPHIRHTANSVLLHVPDEPVICELQYVDTFLTHELIENAQGWELRPASAILRNYKLLLFCFGIPFSILFSGFFGFMLHESMFNKQDVFSGWLAAVLIGIIATIVCGGTPLLLIGMTLRANYKRLSKLTILRNRTNLELETAIAPDVEKASLLDGLNWYIMGSCKRQRLVIPRDQIAAVQLCPWKYTVKEGLGNTSTWAVQGILVLASSQEDSYNRLPLLLTHDFIGAARIMQRLAKTLGVPYLFYADAAGWKTEILRAQNRLPLKTGGI